MIDVPARFGAIQTQTPLLREAHEGRDEGQNAVGLDRDVLQRVMQAGNVLSVDVLQLFITWVNEILLSPDHSFASLCPYPAPDLRSGALRVIH